MRWTLNDHFYNDWAQRKKWTPFQAACLIAGLEPPLTDRDYANIGLPHLPGYTDVHDQIHTTREALGLDEHPEEAVRRLEAIIAVNNDDQSVDPLEITEWAIQNGQLPMNNPLSTALKAQSPQDEHDTQVLLAEIDRLKAEVTKLQAENKELARDSDDRGKHFLRRRMRMYAAALNYLAAHREEVSDKGKVVAARLADKLNDLRESVPYQVDGEEFILKYERLKAYLEHALAGRFDEV